MDQNTNKLRNAVNYLAQSMPNSHGSRNPVENLTVDEISYIQAYLDHIKTNKINESNKNNRNLNRATDVYDPIERETPVDWRDYRLPIQQEQQLNNNMQEPGSRGSLSTRVGKKMANDYNSINDGYNSRNAIQGSAASDGYNSRNAIQGSAASDGYYNPYEYGAKQNHLGFINREVNCGPYQNDKNMLNRIGLNENL